MEAPEFLVGGYFGHAADAKFSPENCHFAQKQPDNNGGNNQFTIDDLEDEVITDPFIDNITGSGSSTDSSSFTVIDSCNSSVSGNISCRNFVDDQLCGIELCVPYDDLAELEWLSNFVEDSFSSDDFQNLQLITATKAPTDTSSSATTTIIAAANRNYQHLKNNNFSPICPSDVSVPCKARSKRSRTAPCEWSSPLLVLSPATSLSEPKNRASYKGNKTTPWKKQENAETPGRKCVHCGSDKTPQWRTGPMGQKTLCNACGVRFKSGRLVPEYRPAASPTFVSTKHSNSHRKVVELRRQKELQRTQLPQPFHSQAQASSIFCFSYNGVDDYLMHHHCGPDFRHAI